MDSQTNYESKYSELEELLSNNNYFQRLLDQLLHLAQSIYFDVNLLVKVILHGPDGSGKRLLARKAAEQLGLKFRFENVCNLFDESIVGTEKKVRASITKLALDEPCLIYLSGYELFCQQEDIDIDRIEHCINETLETLDTTKPIFFIAATNDYHSIYKSQLSRMFHSDLCVAPAEIDEVHEIIETLDKGLEMSGKFTRDSYTLKESKYYLGNIVDYLATHIIDHKEPGSTDCVESSENITKQTHWDDVGGLSVIKDEIKNAFKLSIDHPELKLSGLKRTGILLYGPPGTGKTLLAKAVATECKLKFISVKGPELMNEYVGQSENNVRMLFEKARESSPAVIFFDELDSLVPNRGQARDTGGVMDRIVSQFCAEMDGNNNFDVFIMGATNRVDLVDPSLLRPGRFDKILEVGLPTSTSDRMQILQALTKDMHLAKDVNLAVVESQAPKNISGAELRRICSSALQKAFDRAIDLLESGNCTQDQITVEVSMEDFVMSETERASCPK